jgi:hypothetical protein
MVLLLGDAIDFVTIVYAQLKNVPVEKQRKFKSTVLVFRSLSDASFNASAPSLVPSRFRPHASLGGSIFSSAGA